MNIESKVWDTTKTGTKIHAFGEDGTALCRSSIKHNAGSRMVTKAHAIRWAGNVRAVTICEPCEGRFQASIDAEAADQPEPVKRALVKPEPTVTPAMIEALAWLRNGWDGDNSEKAIEAFEMFDNAGIFAAIDAVTKCTCPPDERRKSGTDNHYIECPEAPVAKCTCPQGGFTRPRGTHRPECPEAPATGTVIGEDDMRDVASRIRARSAARGDDGAAVRMRNARAEGGFGLGTGHLS
jgi:hypothetical protein